MTTAIQRSFAAGEIGPPLYARADQVRYTTGLKTCRNFHIARHGGAYNRAGTQYICEVKDSSRTVKLFKFVFNADQTYVLEFGHQYMRVIRNGAQVAVSGVTAWSNATAYVVGDLASRLGINYYCILAHTNQQPPNATYWAPLTGSIYEIPTPYQESELDELDARAQSADVIVVCHPSHAPRELSRTAHTTWVLSTVTFAPIQAGPTAVSLARGGAGTTVYRYRVTAVATEGGTAPAGEESLVGAMRVATVTGATQANPCVVTVGAGHGFVVGNRATFAGIVGMTQLNGNTYDITAIGATTITIDVDSSAFGAYASGGTATLEGVKSATPTTAAPIVVTWTAAAGTSYYNIYRETAGVYGWIGKSTTTTFSDENWTSDSADNPPEARNPFGSSGNYPSVCTHYRGRRIFANTNNDPETCWASRSGMYKNFTVSSPLADDDAVTFLLGGRQVNEVRHLVELGMLLGLTSGGEWAIAGDEAAGLKATAPPNQKQWGEDGSALLPPIVAGGRVLYVQARGSIIRELGYNLESNGYGGDDITIFSPHLVENHTIEDWCHQREPHSIVWAVRDDGVLLGITYVPRHEVVAWHRHDTDGTFENVCAVPEGTEDSLYVVVKRTINGATKRYIERMASRFVDEDAIEDSTFLDSYLTYDGRNTTTSHTMAISDGSAYDTTETLLLTSSTSYFTAGDVGNEIHLTGADGTIIRFRILTYTSGTEVHGRVNRDVPVAMQVAAISNWARAVDEVTGLTHLAAKNVSIFADGFVVANPNNDAYTVRTVTAAGAVTLDACYGVIHVGLPITADLATLDIETTQSETMADKKKLIRKISVFLEKSRGVFAGAELPEDDDDLDGLNEIKIRSDEDSNDPVDLATGVEEVKIQSRWSRGGGLAIRQTDPVPAAVLAVAPAGVLPLGR